MEYLSIQKDKCLKSLSCLPLEIIYKILTLLPYYEILSFCKINSRYYEIVKDTYFWSKKAKLDFNSSIFIDKFNTPLKAYLELLSQFHYFKGCEYLRDRESCFLLALNDRNIQAMQNIKLYSNSRNNIYHKYSLCYDNNYLEGEFYFGSMLNEQLDRYSNIINNLYYLNIGLEGEKKEIQCELSNLIDLFNINVNDMSNIYNNSTLFLGYISCILDGIIINDHLSIFIDIYQRVIHYINLRDIIYKAAQFNNYDIVNYILENYNYNHELLMKCFEGSLHGNNLSLADDMIKLGLQYGTANIYQSLSNIDCFRYVINLNNLEYSHVSKFIYNCKRYDIISLFNSKYFDASLRQQNSDNINRVREIFLAQAFKLENVYLIKYLISLNTDINECLRHLLPFGRINIKIILLLLRYGANEKKLICMCFYRGYFKGVKYLICMFAPEKDYIESILKSTEYRHNQVYDIINKKKNKIIDFINKYYKINN